MKILLVNPNTSAAMTASIAAAARAVAAPGTVIEAVQPSFGPASVEGHFDEAFAAAGVAEQVRLATAVAPPAAAIDAVVIACFGDPGLDAARELSTAPVLGIAEAAFHAAAMLATGFSVVTTLTRTCITAERLVQRYGFERACRGIHGTDIAVLALDEGGDATLAQIEAVAREALARDRSGAIVLGCAGMAALCHTLQQRLGVPVIDGVAVAVKFAEALAALGLQTSKRGDYAPPLHKAWVGWAAPLGLTPPEPMLPEPVPR
ncbi:aspartate/glutamate racemase family protein [Aquabacterium sp.]|uniref:aspartate/glutamate racemase family protein n=1 Tax=Aquabacterium sp. TaxID=1872578 RepID=UPI002BB7E2B2|nr:aspartate/glutamate racemase family protein [Aquabacterium sp.]HSW07650.1 aspartate/glutamate racemase family protein [Aquabacterium sp.]